eukprot:TRINITY_DN4423_c0_g2_i4.p1 TRINITY_DN4423_c0_g2~~TRINITY_DN4423_c0_g2_i4.p1  ORF type:complete len:692 (-),score=84.31 TRINITY_DN4423_c0_g2_i4:337-2412(-)
MRAISFGAQSSRYVEVQKKYEYRRVIQMSSSNQFSKPTMGSSKHNRGITAQQLEQLYVDYQMSAPYKCQYEGGPRFFSPLIPWMCYENAQELPVMIFLPGIDGTGFGAFRQFCRLAQIFNLSILLTPTSDRTCFQDLIAIVKEYLELEAQSISTSRPIYLFGESFGAIMAMAVAVECRDIVDRLILVNPASGFPRTLWKQAAPILAMMPAQIYDYFPYFMMPLFANVAAVVSHRVDYKSTPQQQISQLLQGMVEQLPEADALQLLLPHDCLLWKIQQVDSGCQYMEQVGGYQNVLQRTLILTSDQDLIVPARQEGERLQNMLPRVTTVNLANRAHAVLLEAGVDLANIIKESGFYTVERNMTSNSVVRKGNYFGTAGPIELPTNQELRKHMQHNNQLFSIANVTRLLSPVFLSTDQHDRISLGLDKLFGRSSQRAMLFVGNHQFMGLDFQLIVCKLLQEKGILARGLHISHVQGKSLNIFPFHQLITYGAVQTNPLNLHDLLKSGEAVILFTPPASHALKRCDDGSNLMWGEQCEFVRMASKFGATIIPFSSFGLDDSITQIMPPQDILKLPFIGEYVKQQIATYGNIDPRKWWYGNSHNTNDSLATPFAIQALQSQRFYVKFGKPIFTKEEWVVDKEQCDQVQKEVQLSVESGLVYLQDKRKTDPYKDIIQRLIFEASWNFQKQAPTFTP